MNKTKDYTIAEISTKLDEFIKQKCNDVATLGLIKLETVVEPTPENGERMTIQLTMPGGFVPPELMHLFKPAGEPDGTN